MRIVIDTDQPDDGRGTTRVAETERGAVDLDGGPAPAALLRRFGRIPEVHAEIAAPEAAEARAPESEGGDKRTYNLLHGRFSLQECAGGQSPRRI